MLLVHRQLPIVPFTKRKEVLLYDVLMVTETESRQKVENDIRTPFGRFDLFFLHNIVKISGISSRRIFNTKQQPIPATELGCVH